MSKKAIKVSHNGETKRFKITQSYETLAFQTRDMFGNDLAKVWPIKFYYVDDEQELISISSQSDFLEALTIDELPILKLTVANNVQDARVQLEAMHSQSLSLTESLNQSQIMNSSIRMSMTKQFGNMPSIPRLSDINPFGVDLQSLPETERNEYKKISHEMGVGNNMVNQDTQSVSTDVRELVKRGEIGVNTKSATTNDANTLTSLSTAQVSIQAEAQTKDAGCDGGPAIKTVHNGNQMEELKQANQEIECNILMVSDEEDDEEYIEEHIDCFKCKGTQVNSKGLPCRKCNGSGLFNLKGYGSVVKSVREEIEVYCTEQFKALYSDYTMKNMVYQKDQIHTDYSCNECGCDPIKGIRYQSTVYEDYDLCQKCEAKGIHSEHVLLKIRKVNQGQHKFMCEYKELHGNSQTLSQSQKPSANYKQESINTFVSSESNIGKKDSKKGAIRYQGRFVKESIGDKYQVKPGQVFTKTWTYRNSGDSAWAKDVMFIQTSGDDMGAQAVAVTQVVEADQEYTWEVTFKAPERVGKYTSYFRMQTGHNIRYGHKVWCDIQVLDNEEQKVMQEEKPIEVSESIVKFDFSVEEQKLNESINIVMPESVQVKIEQPIEIQKLPELPIFEAPTSPKLRKTPQQSYIDKVNSPDTKPEMRESLQMLLDCGYINFETNQQLLAKHCNNIEAVMNHLLDNQN